jgi:hypothetical protein
MSDPAMENPPAEAPPAEAPAANEAADPNNDEEKKGLIAVPKVPNPFDEEEYVPTEISGPDKYTLTPCCCCLCACSHDRVGDATCFGCLPIRCGVVFIAIQVFCLAVILITVTFFELLNEYLPWWYVFVMLLLLIPLAISASINIYFFARDKRTTRGKLLGSIIMAIISMCLWTIWKLVFYLAIYKRDTVYVGMGNANDPSNYRETPKRSFIFYTLAEAIIILVFLTYYTCVINQYVNLMNYSYDEQARLDAEKEKLEKEHKEQ